MERLDQDNLIMDNDNVVVDHDAAAEAAIAADEQEELRGGQISNTSSSSSDNNNNNINNSYYDVNYNVDFLESCAVRYPDVGVLYLAGLNAVQNDDANDRTNHRRSMVVYDRLPVDWEEIDGPEIRVPLSVKLHLMRVVLGEQRGCAFSDRELESVKKFQRLYLAYAAEELRDW